MSTEHDAVTSLSEFWRTLAIVVVGFGVALVLSWTIDAAFPRMAVDALATGQHTNI